MNLWTPNQPNMIAITPATIRLVEISDGGANPENVGCGTPQAGQITARRRMTAPHSTQCLVSLAAVCVVACGGAALSGFGLADVGNGGGPAVDCDRTSSTNGAVNCWEHCGQRTSVPRSWSGTCTCVEHP